MSGWLLVPLVAMSILVGAAGGVGWLLLGLKYDDGPRP